MVTLHWRNTTCCRQFCCWTDAHGLPHDDKEGGNGEVESDTKLADVQFLMSPNGILFIVVAAFKAVIDVGFSHNVASVIMQSCQRLQMSRQSLMSPLSQIVPETQAARERGHLCCHQQLCPRHLLVLLVQKV